MCSIPTLTRIASGSVPDKICSSSESCECVVDAGCMTSCSQPDAHVVPSTHRLGVAHIREVTRELQSIDHLGAELGIPAHAERQDPAEVVFPELPDRNSVVWVIRQAGVVDPPAVRSRAVHIRVESLDTHETADCCCSHFANARVFCECRSALSESVSTVISPYPPDFLSPMSDSRP